MNQSAVASRQEAVEPYFQRVARVGGMITCGGHLGVMVGTDVLGCPRGWVFLPLEMATAELVAEAVEHAKRGRAAWPKDQKAKAKETEEQMLERLFDSQDYIGAP